MTWRALVTTAGAFAAMACGGSEFETTGTGGAAGGGGSSATGGTTSGGGTAGTGGTTSGGGTAGTGGTTSGGGTAGTGGSAGAAGSGGSTGSITVVQATPIAIDTVADVPTITLGALPSAGNAIIVGISCFSEVDNCTIPAGGVTDNQGNTYSLAKEGASVTSSTTHGARPYLFIAEAIAAPSGSFVISVDPNGSQLNNQMVTWGAIEVSGLAAAPSLDQTGSTSVEANTSTTVSTAAPTVQANELAVAVLTDRTNDTDAMIAPQAGWTQHHVNQDITPAMPHSMVSTVLSVAAVASHTWTHDLPTRGTVSVIATFKGASPN